MDNHMANMNVEVVTSLMAASADGVRYGSMSGASPWTSSAAWPRRRRIAPIGSSIQDGSGSCACGLSDSWLRSEARTSP